MCFGGGDFLAARILVVSLVGISAAVHRNCTVKRIVLKIVEVAIVIRDRQAILVGKLLIEPSAPCFTVVCVRRVHKKVVVVSEVGSWQIWFGKEILENSQARRAYTASIGNEVRGTSRNHVSRKLLRSEIL